MGTNIITAKLTGKEKATLAAHALEEGKAEDIIILDMHEISTITDYFVICTGNSTTHLRALGKRIEDAFASEKIKPTAIDGARTTGWLVFDFGNVIVHAMTNEQRRLYDLERLWADAPRETTGPEAAAATKPH